MTRDEINIGGVQHLVALYYGVEKDDILSRSRVARFRYPRHVAMYLCREILPDVPLTDVARCFDRNHSTVISACGKMADELGYDRRLREDIAAARAFVGKYTGLAPPA